MRQDRSQVLKDVFAHYGSITALARELGITKAAVSSWKQVPIKHLFKISREAGILRAKLRPDLYED